MATVIDSLLIELGLDTTKFNSAQKKSVESLRKLDEQSQKTGKTLQKSSKDMGEGFEKARDALVSFGVSLFSVSAFSNFVGTMTAANNKLNQNAKLFNMSTIEVNSWGNTLKTVGGNADDFIGSMQAMQQTIAGMKIGQIDENFLFAQGVLKAQGAFNIQSGEVNIYKLADALKAYRLAGHTEQDTLRLAEMLHLNRSMYLVMKDGSATLRETQERMKELSYSTQENADSASAYTKNIGFASAATEGLGNMIAGHLYPRMDTLSKMFTSVVSEIEKMDKATEGAIGEFGALEATGLVLTGILGGIAVFMGAPVAATLGAGALAVTGVAAVSAWVENLTKTKTTGVGSGGLNSKLSSALQAAGLHIISGVRDEAKQKAMYDAWVAGGKKGNPVAPPGHSHHQTGDAADISDAVSNAYLASYGLYRPMGAKDPNHIELLNRAGSAGSNSTRNVQVTNNIGQITTHTQASSPDGIGRATAEAMQQQALLNANIMGAD